MISARATGLLAAPKVRDGIDIVQSLVAAAILASLLAAGITYVWRTGYNARDAAYQKASLELAEKLRTLESDLAEARAANEQTRQTAMADAYASLARQMTTWNGISPASCATPAETPAKGAQKAAQTPGKGDKPKGGAKPAGPQMPASGPAKPVYIKLSATEAKMLCGLPDDVRDKISGIR